MQIGSLKDVTILGKLLICNIFLTKYELINYFLCIAFISVFAGSIKFHQSSLRYEVILLLTSKTLAFSVSNLLTNLFLVGGGGGVLN